MKELSIKEKAKCYDKAFERAKEKYTKCYSPTLLDYIFPELKENKDIEIRRSIIRNLKRYIKCIKDGYDASSAKDFVVKEIEKQIAWLEKQGEQKPANSYCQENCKGFQETGKCFADGDCKAKREAESNDKNEPKFHEGDWVIYNNDICQIVKREEGCNILVTQFGVEKEPVNERNLSTAKLWDISDAMDGDVLAYKNDNVEWILIYKNIITECCDVPHDVLNYHALFTGTVFYNSGSAGMISENYALCFTPATKEQRDTLFAKMKEAGYIFDFEKKELKKIETEIEIPFGAKDSELQEATYYIPKGFHAEIEGDKVVIKKGEKPTAWSKKDEKMFEYALNMIEWYSGKNEDKSRYVSDWLKSLKQRIGG